MKILKLSLEKTKRENKRLRKREKFVVVFLLTYLFIYSVKILFYKKIFFHKKKNYHWYQYDNEHGLSIAEKMHFFIIRENFKTIFFKLKVYILISISFFVKFWWIIWKALRAIHGPRAVACLCLVLVLSVETALWL